MLKSSAVLVGVLVIGAGLKAADQGLEAVTKRPDAVTREVEAYVPVGGTWEGNDPSAAPAISHAYAWSKNQAWATAFRTEAASHPAGLSYEPIPEVVRAHLPKLGKDVRGTCIVDVTAGSPAALGTAQARPGVGRRWPVDCRRPRFGRTVDGRQGVSRVVRHSRRGLDHAVARQPAGGGG